MPQQEQARLTAAVQSVYQAFRAYTAPTSHLDACTACCMDAEVERELRDTKADIDSAKCAACPCAS